MRSFINVMKFLGPDTLPWGTPPLVFPMMIQFWLFLFAVSYQGENFPSIHLLHRRLPNVLFKILIISYWVVAALLMTDKTNVGVAVFIADTTCMCGFGSDGAAALLSARSLVRCCSHRCVFACL